MHLQAGHVKMSQNFTTALPNTELLFSVVSICVDNVFYHWIRAGISTWKKLLSLLYSHWSQQSAIPCCWCNDGLADYFFQRTIHVIIWWYEVSTVGLMQQQHCPSKNLWWSLWCAHLHAAKHCHGGATIWMFFLWDIFDKCEHSDLLLLQYSSWSLLLSR